MENDPKVICIVSGDTLNYLCALLFDELASGEAPDEIQPIMEALACGATHIALVERSN